MLASGQHHHLPFSLLPSRLSRRPDCPSHCRCLPSQTPGTLQLRAWAGTCGGLACTPGRPAIPARRAACAQATARALAATAFLTGQG